MLSSRYFKNLRIRHKLLFSYTAAFVLVLGLSSIVMYTVVRRTLQANIEHELENSTEALRNTVETAVSVSIKNYLRAVAESNREIVAQLYARYRQGEFSEAEARARAEAVLLSQRIGTTGYIACVNSRGVMVLHPKKAWVGQDITEHAFVRRMIREKTAYLEYEWKNPGEQTHRPKALYCTYFEPWDWIINASSYRDEFKTLVKIGDFRESILAMRFGRTGYAFVLDKEGDIIIHPRLEGVNILKQTDPFYRPIRKMFGHSTGKLTYDWQNPGDTRPRRKLVIYKELPEYQWIVAASSYEDEFYTPLLTVSRVIIFTVLFSWLLLLPISFLISRTITEPLRGLVGRLSLAGPGDFSGRVPKVADDEIGQLAGYYNSFMDRLEEYSRSLQAEIAERKEAEVALRISEEKFRSVMEAAPDPIIVYDMDGRVGYLNPAFTRVYGWTPEECLGRKLDRFVPADTWEETRQGLDRLLHRQSLSNVETRRYTRDGGQIEVSISGAVQVDRDGRPMACITIHRDISELRRLEKQVMDAGDLERQNLGQDLHDDLAPHLIGIEGLATVLVRKLAGRDAAEAQLAGEITRLIKEATTKTRRLARGLCPVYLVDRGLAACLQELAVHTAALFGIRCVFKAEAEVAASDTASATHVFRIAQEAVTNAVRHGHADHVSIVLKRVEGLPRLVIRDNGAGFSPDTNAAGMGLRIMGFRAKMIRATLEIANIEEGGCQVTLTLPAEGVQPAVVIDETPFPAERAS